LNIEPFVEEWDTLDPDYWTITNPSAGGASDWTAGPTAVVKLMSCYLGTNDTARLASQSNFQCHPYLLNLQSISSIEPYYERFVFKWSAQFFTTQTNIDNSKFFMGLSQSDTADRSSNNLIGFFLDSDNFKGITDDTGTELTTTTSVALDANLHFFTIVLEKGYVYFWVDETFLGYLEPTNTTKYSPYFNFFVDTDGGGGCNAYFGSLYAWSEPVPSKNGIWDSIPRIDVKKETDTLIPVVLTSADDDDEAVSEIYWGDLTIEYARDDESAWTTYSHTNGDWTEIGDGLYALNIGASEFDEKNQWVMVRVEDNNASARPYMIRCDVKRKTFDEHFDDTGGGSGSTYNITNNYKENRKDFKDQNDELNKILERLSKLLSRTARTEDALNKLKKKVV